MDTHLPTSAGPWLSNKAVIKTGYLLKKDGSDFQRNHPFFIEPWFKIRSKAPKVPLGRGKDRQSRSGG